MKLLTTRDILDKDAYEQARADFRRLIMVQKDKRRVLVGQHMTFHFENRDTMRYQVQEMLRAESSWNRPEAIEDEVETYNALIPQRGELSATMMIEYETAQERAVMLPQLVGIEEHVKLQIGDTTPVLAVFDRRQVDDHKVSSVQYLKWMISDAQRQLLQTDGTVVRLIVDHRSYKAQAVLSEQSRLAIAHDPD